MPYIKKEDRERLLKENVNSVQPKSAGELNFLITTICLNYLMKFNTRYETINAIIGALHCAAMEFYRRLAIPYEEGKISENGDVF